MEASSHGLIQGRLGGINFKAGIFNNLSQDHMDYHKSMKRYYEAKTILLDKTLFNYYRSKVVFSLCKTKSSDYDIRYRLIYYQMMLYL